MAQTVTLELPDEVARSARGFALHTQRRLEEVLVEWIDQAVAELPIDSLSDEQILALCEAQLGQGQQEELSELLASNREGTLDRAGQAHLDQVMQQYRRGLVRKAQALKIAVERGLRPPLN